MALNAVYENQETFEAEVAEHFRELYAEKDGKYELAGIVGIKTEADIERLNEALRKERADHKTVKDSLAAWGDLDPEQVRERMDGYDELVARADANEDKIDKDKLEELANAKVVTETAPLKRQIDELTTERDELLGQNTDFKDREVRRTVSDSVREAATKLKVLPHAMDDVLLLAERVFEVGDDGVVLTKDEVGCTPGVDAEIWLGEVQSSKTHWWPLTEGGGAGGGGGGTSFKSNPWSKDHWNLTEQGRVVREDGREKADQMAKSAGTTLGAPRPISTKDSN